MGPGVDEVVSTVKSLAKEVGITLRKKDVQSLLLWMTRRNLAKSPVHCLRQTVLETVGRDLFDSACIGNKEALTLLPTYGSVRAALEKVANEACLWATVHRMLLSDGDSENKQAPMELPIKNDLKEGSEQVKEEARLGDKNNVEQEKEEGGKPFVAPLRVRLDREGIATPSAPPAEGSTVHTSSDGSFWGVNKKGSLILFPAGSPEGAGVASGQAPAFSGSLRPPLYAVPPVFDPGEREGGEVRVESFSEKPLPSSVCRVPVPSGATPRERERVDSESSTDEESRDPRQVTPRQPMHIREEVQKAREKWTISARECLLSGCEITPSPVRIGCFPVFAGSQGHQWQPVDYKMLLQLKKAVQEGGFSSPQTQVLLDAVALQGPLMFDWRQVARACLTAAQVPMLESLLEEEGEVLMARAWANPQDPLHGMSGEALLGRGRWNTPQEQLLLPQAVLIAAADLGRRALERMNAVVSPTPSYLHIRQKPEEHFGRFADRVQTAVASSNLPPEAQDVVLRECLRTGAQPEFKAALAALPASASAGELIARGCAFGKAQEMQPLAAALSEQMAGVTSALQTFALQIHPGGCFRCGQRGHVARECPEKREPVVEVSRIRCWVCGRSGHRARECSQRKGEVKEGKRDGQSGNANAGTKRDPPSRPQAWVPTPIEQGWTSPPSSLGPENDWYRELLLFYIRASCSAHCFLAMCLCPALHFHNGMNSLPSL
ncbi:uncharacterized protein [Anas platyrhynchos]|uniref:uncharacterized protein isoform X3 n=1 Tax=Anas platyrhynchos TaxID=8839 RepID=UPI003AF25AB2